MALTSGRGPEKLEAVPTSRGPVGDRPDMTQLTTALLGRACEIFLHHAYPDGEIPPPRRPYAAIAPDQSLEPLLAPPVCQVLPAAGGGVRGYAFRLGSVIFPHLKLQAVECDARWVFSVDTHDAIRLDPTHPDAARWAQVQAANRALKERIEEAWDAAGLWTFNGLLRHELAEPGATGGPPAA